jgi:hypothetical protein
MRGRISTILLYSGYPKFLKPALESLASQTRASDEICIVDLGGSTNAREVLQSMDRKADFAVIERRFDDEQLPDVLARALETCSGDYLFLARAHNLLVPTCLEVTASALDSNSELAAVCTDVKLFGLEDAIITPSIAELLAYPERDCYPLFRAESVKRVGGFCESNEQIFVSDVVLKLIAEGLAVEFIPQWLVLARYEDSPHNPQLHRPSTAFDRKAFLNRFESLFNAHAKEVVLCLEQEHWRQFQRAENSSENVHNILADVRKKHRDLEKLHNEALSSVSVTGSHLLSALKKKILS